MAAGDLAGSAVAGGGDLNADGHPDAILGAPFDDGSGRVSASAYILDLAAPDTTINAASPLTNDPTPTFVFHASEPASFQCSIDRGTPPLHPARDPAQATHPPLRCHRHVHLPRLRRRPLRHRRPDTRYRNLHGHVDGINPPPPLSPILTVLRLTPCRFRVDGREGTTISSCSPQPRASRFASRD